MKNIVLLFFLFLISCDAVHQPEECGGTHCDPEAVEEAIEGANPTNNGRYGVYFHSNEALEVFDYIRALNYHFYPIQFYLAGKAGYDELSIDDVTPAVIDSLPFIRRPTEKLINVYFCKPSDSGLLGFAYMPTRNFESIKTDDLFWKTFVSYAQRPISTTIHEIGHLFSMVHPWQSTEEHGVCNVMDYTVCGTEFEPWQVEQMVAFNFLYR